MGVMKQASEAERVAETLGTVLGAASCAEGMTAERLISTSAKLREMAMAMAEDSADAEAASARFSSAVEEARLAAVAGSLDPEDAENALCEIEEELST